MKNTAGDIEGREIDDDEDEDGEGESDQIENSIPVKLICFYLFVGIEISIFFQ